MKPSIIVDYDNETLDISKVFKPNDEIVGPYLSMYLYKYRNFKWVDWADKSVPSLQSIQDLTKELNWEEYIFSIIVKEGTSPTEVDGIIKEAGYTPDYILERNNGLVKLLHQTNYIEDLIDNGYTLTDVENGEGNYSFGRGLYCLDKDNFAGVESDWVNADNVYTGAYEGEYLRCIEDIHNGGKSGLENKFQQELIIPFTEDEIKWEAK